MRCHLPYLGEMATKQQSRRSSRSTNKQVRRKRPMRRPADTVLASTILAWLEKLTDPEGGPNRGRLVNGRPVGDTAARALYRWEHEGTMPGLAAVESTLASFGLVFRNLEEWATDNNQPLWFHGQPPAWYSDCSNSRWREDLRSSDPKFAAEARQEANSSGQLKPRKSPRQRPRQSQQELVAA